MPRETILYYLIYGFVFIAMGVSAWQHGNDQQVGNLPLARQLPNLGGFGVVHGLTEWMTMLLATGLFFDFLLPITMVRSVMKTISFAFFLRFAMGMTWYQKETRNLMFYLPWGLLTLWLSIFAMILFRDKGYTGVDQMALLNIWLVRYGMAVPAGLLTFYAFRRDARLLQQRKRPIQGQKTSLLAVAFLVYGILDGLVVRSSPYFPANIINHGSFMQLTGLPVQLVKAMTGAVILWGLSGLLGAYRDEARAKVNALLQLRGAEAERRRIGMALHDGIIQKLYASGLKLGYLEQVKLNQPMEYKVLQEARMGIDESMDIVRELLNRELEDTVAPENLMVQLNQLVEEYRALSGMDIAIANKIPGLQMGKISDDQATHLYYIVQEALCNGMKHSQSKRMTLTLETTLTELLISIRDYGTGFIRTQSAERSEGKGLELMKQRAEEAGGRLRVKSQKTGVQVDLQIPWEE